MEMQNGKSGSISTRLVSSKDIKCGPCIALSRTHVSCSLVGNVETGKYYFPCLNIIQQLFYIRRK